MMALLQNIRLLDLPELGGTTLAASRRVWVSTAEACEVLGKSRETLRHLRR